MTETNHAARWEARYAGESNLFGLDPNEFLRSQAHLFRPGQRALVPGDGEGRNGVWLAEQGLDVTTIDLAASGVKKARAFATARNVTIDARQADLAQWSWPVGTFDVVASIFLHLPAAIRSTVHGNMLRALRPGGLLVLEAFRPAQLALQRGGAGGRGSGGPPDPALLYAAATLRDDFPGVQWLVLDETETDLAEGTHHVGPAAVVRGIFRRP